MATEGNSYMIQQLISGKIDFGISGTPESISPTPMAMT